ncbi:hypothetical protein HYC85_023644 [Camellia sinensis]|uniref:GOLD domain-containing protein n=1 Tax=Camellia sinensis TaxID=4442 RepID=A0A7J7GGF6_CAMSI|nr:hypothetical protein HYC85_023644 [Camellia sinensis]
MVEINRSPAQRLLSLKHRCLFPTYPPSLSISLSSLFHRYISLPLCSSRIHSHLSSSLILLGFISNAVQSLRFDFQSSHSKCIAEDIKTNSMSIAKYTIVNPNDPLPFPKSHKITVRAAEAEDYMTCFWALDHKPQSTITIDFDWKTGVAAKDWTNVAKKGTIDGFSCLVEVCSRH